MRLTTVIFIASLMQVSAAGFAQKITLDRRNVPLESLLKEIRQQSGYDYYYDAELIGKDQKVSISVKGASLEETLKAALSGLPLEYEIDGKIITLNRKMPSFLDKAATYLTAIDVRGRILDEGGKPLEGATVVLKGSNRTAKTDVKGEFVLANVPDDGVLVIRYVGYKQLEISLKDAVMPLEIKLNVATGELEEVNVTYSTGYQNIPKERATGSFVQIDNELINRSVWVFQAKWPVIPHLNCVSSCYSLSLMHVKNESKISKKSKSDPFKQEAVGQA